MNGSNLGRRRALSALAILGAGASILFARDARATSVIEIGDNGSEQMGRGGAWVARASDPLATFYNPAGLAGQETRLTLQANVNIQSTCFSRLKAGNDVTTGDGLPAGSGATQAYPQVCSNNSPFPDPQLAFAYRVNSRLGLGIAVVAPSAAGNLSWPSTVNGSPAPQRYLLLSADNLILTPTIGVGWEPLNGWRIGASFLWGIASFDLTNDSVPFNEIQPGPQAATDIKAELKVKNLFVPGFTVGTIWTPVDNFDIAGWYKWLDPIVAKGDIDTTVGSGNHVATTNTALSDCGYGQPAGTCQPGLARFKITVPMEAKIGFRYHQPRPGVEQAHRRDPMATDIFDVEADLTWANDSALDNIYIQFPGTRSGVGVIPVNGADGGDLPPNANIPHNFKDVYGVRFGGDYNVLPDQLAVRAGAYFESAAVDPQYLNVDFAGEQRVGIAAGGTYRIHLSRESSKALELSLGFGHTFIASLTNPGPSGINGLAGTPCAAGTVPTITQTSPSTCSNGVQTYRTPWPINLGTVTNSFSQINVGASYRF